MLPLVLMQALDLHIEDRVGRDFHAALAFDERGEFHLVGALDRHEFAAETGVVGERFEAAQQIKIARPSFTAENAGYERSEARDWICAASGAA
jgi:hypothetical protein